MELDKKHLGKTNFVVIKSAIDKKCNTLIGKSSGQRHDFYQDELIKIENELDGFVLEVEKEFFKRLNQKNHFPLLKHKGLIIVSTTVNIAYLWVILDCAY